MAQTLLPREPPGKRQTGRQSQHGARAGLRGQASLKASVLLCRKPHSVTS